MRLWCLALSLPLLLPLSARADFADGLRAYDAGDYESALVEWTPLARAGDGDALLALAGLYRQGLGTAPDLARAADLYRRAAEQGAVIAQLNLGDLYARGQGVTRDLVRAYMWLELAARQQHGWAAMRRDGIRSAMTAAQVAEARRLADAWRPGKTTAR